MENFNIEILETYSGETHTFNDPQEAMDWVAEVEEGYEEEEIEDFDFEVVGLEVFDYKFITPCTVDIVEELTEYDEEEVERMIALIQHGIGFEDDLWRTQGYLEEATCISGYSNEEEAFEEYLEEIGWFEDIPMDRRCYINVGSVLYDYKCEGLTVVQVLSQDVYLFIN